MKQPHPHNPGPYAQGPYAPGPYAPMPPRPPRRSSGVKIVIGLGIAFAAFVALVAIGAAASDAEHAARERATAAPTPADKPAAPADDKDKKKPADKPTEYGDGDHIIGEDIPPGTYQTTGAKPGLFELCTITTEQPDGTIGQLKNSNANERIIITITEADHSVSISGCEPLTPRK